METLSKIDANAWQYFFAFMEHNKLFTLTLVIIAAIVLLLIKKIVAIPCNIFTGKINNSKIMLTEWEKDITIFASGSHKFTDDHAKNLLFNRLAEKILSSYYFWKKQDCEKLKKKIVSIEEISSAEYQKNKIDEIRKRWKASFTNWCKLQQIPKDKIKHIIKSYDKIAAGEIKTLNLMISRLSGNYDYISLLFYTILNAIEFDLEEAASSFNGDLAGLNIEGYTIKGGHSNGITDDK